MIVWAKKTTNDTRYMALNPDSHTSCVTPQTIIANRTHMPDHHAPNIHATATDISRRSGILLANQSLGTPWSVNFTLEHIASISVMVIAMTIGTYRNHFGYLMLGKEDIALGEQLYVEACANKDLETAQQLVAELAKS